MPGEVDRTPLVSYTAISRTIILRRLGELERAGWIDAPRREQLAAAVEMLPSGGVPISSLRFVERPGVVSLADAGRAAGDFVVMRSNRESIRLNYDWSALVEGLWDEVFATPPDWVFDGVLVQSAAEPGSGDTPRVRLYDAGGHCRVELGFDAQPGGGVRFVEQQGVELPERLRLLRVWERGAETGELLERNMRSADKWVVAQEPSLFQRVRGQHP